MQMKIHKSKHHHDPKKFKFGILKYSISSKVVNPTGNDEKMGSSVNAESFSNAFQEEMSQFRE